MTSNKHNPVAPVKAGAHAKNGVHGMAWIPAFTGMTICGKETK